MSKKQLHSRLETLFSPFEEKDSGARTTPGGSLPSWAWECDASGCYTAIGEEVSDCLGYQPGRLIGQPVHLFPVAGAFRSVLHSALQDPLTSEIDVYLQAAEGVFLPVRFRIQAQQGKNGRPTGRSGQAQVLSTEIPEPQLKIKPATPTETPKTADGDSALTDYPLGVSAHAGVLSPASELWTEAGRESLQARQVVAKSSTADTPAALAAPIELRSGETGVLELIAAGRQRRWTQDERLLVQEVANQLALAIENARAYQMAQKAVEEMREVDRLKSQFLANMSHELRTPLNSIIGFSKVILKGIDGPINEVQEQDLSSIFNSGQHLLSLINNILDLSKVEAGKMELQFEEVNLNDIINSVMSTAIGLVRDKPVKLHSIVPPDLPVVTADSTRIRQVLLNFISNAAKFTEKGSITVEAKQILSPASKPEIQVAVTDTGDGIAEADHAKLFLPFSQVDDSPTRKTGGTGLGLSICRSFIELHGGRIGLLRSEVGVGSTFFFTLPLTLPEADPMPEEEPAEASKSVVLAIDDDLQVAQLYQRYLEPQGHTVVPLTDPRLAVQQAKSLHPVAITLDLMMPEVDGWQVLQALKNDPDTRQIPVIICSLQEAEEKGFSLGAADYLVKPFLADDLLHAIERLDQGEKISRILYVDDSPDDLSLVQKMLEDKRQVQIQTACGGQQALEYLKTAVPDVILLDLFMPEMDGFTLLDLLRS
ncbi:MAG TPA: response regulator, partial [Anaerolineaceae bacterium]|nr:response regulator [Anaerolineaceae bacterium]